MTDVILPEGIPTWAIEDLVPYRYNPRTHTDAQIEQIVASMKEFGFTNPIIVDKDTREIIAGHGRLQAAQRLGLRQVPVIALSHLNEAKRHKLIIADNQLALNSGWDMREWVGGRNAKGFTANGISIENKHFEATIDIPLKHLRRDKTGQIEARIGELATRTNSHWALLLSELICKGETQECYDGKPFFATNHKEGKSGDQANKIVFDLGKAKINGEVGTADAPTEAALREAILQGIQQIISFKDDQGQPTNENATRFVVMVPVSLTDEIGLVSDTLTLELDDRDGVFEIPPRGAELEAFLGYDALYPMGKFVVDEAELKSPPATMTITARASNSGFRDMGAFKSPHSYSWEDYTLLGIVQTIAGRYGLSESVAEDFKKILVKHIDQTDESDCAFIQRLAADYGASVKIAGGKLLFIEPLSGKFPDGTPLPSIPIKESEICGYQMRLAERGKYGKVIAKYYDFDAAEEKQVSVGSGSPAFTLRDVFTSAAQARLRATSKLNEISSGTRTLSLDLIGNPLICAESAIDVPSVRPEVSKRWIVKSVRHVLTASGYKTTIEATKPKGE